MRVYVHILSSVICDEIMRLSCMIYYDGKYGDLMHNCIFMCIGIYSLYDEYGRVQYKTKMTIMFTMSYNGHYSLRVFGNSLEKLA